MTNETPIMPGEIVQLNPETTGNKAFRGCLMVVSEVRQWGVQGYVQSLGATRDEMGGQAYYRADTGTFERTGGKAPWIIP